MVGLREILLSSTLLTLTVLSAAGAGTTMSPGPAPAARPTEAPQFWFGVEVENIPPAIARQLKLRPEQGLMLRGVFASSPAARAGLRADDLLIEIDDQPLTSQEDLAAAANGHLTSQAVAGTARAAANGQPQIHLTYLRDGERHVALLAPEPRPADMRAAGANLQSFVAGQTAGGPRAGAAQPLLARNYVLPDGAMALVGPGYRISLNGNGNTGETVRSIQKAVSQGQTVILSQEVDARGAVKNTITVGDKSYVVDPSMTNVPASLKPLARQMLNNAPVPRVAVTGAAPVASRPMTIEERLGMLENRLRAEEVQNDALRRQLSDLIDLLHKQQAGAAVHDAADAGPQGK